MRPNRGGQSTHGCAGKNSCRERMDTKLPISHLSADNMMMVSIGIVLYENDDREIWQCLDSVTGQNAGVEVEILVRDQSGGCLPAVERWQAERRPQCAVRTWSGPNVGFGGGHNALFREIAPASHAYLCLNPDGILHPDCISELIKQAEARSWNGIFEALHEPIMHPKYFDPVTGATAWCSAACLLIPRAIYLQLGGYDEAFFLYCEDVDLSWRVKALGASCVTVRSALFFHYAADRRGRASEMWKSAFMLAHKWRATKFSEFAMGELCTLLDLDRQQLGELTKGIDQVPLESVFKASPNFSERLVFATPMWK